MSLGTPKTLGTGFGFSTATPSFGSPSAQSGLNFGGVGQTGLASGTPQQQQTSGITFGTPTNTQPITLNFGTPTAAPTTAQTGLNFGTPTSTPQTGLTFGTPTPNFGQTSLNFGATSQPSSGISFGTPAAATPAFNAAAAPAFNAAAAPAFNAAAAPAFNAAATPAFNAAATPAFNAAATPAFNAAATPAFNATATPAFNAPAASTAFGLPATSTAFGSPATSTTFGAPATSTAFGTLGTTSTFGSPATSGTFGSATPTFGALPSGAATTPATTAAFGLTVAPQFGSATTSAFGLSATTSTAGLVTATTATPSLGFGSNVGTTSTAASTIPLSFGLGSSTTTSRPLGLFSSTPAAAAAATTATGLFGSTPNTTQSTAFSLGTGTGLFAAKPFGTLGSNTAVATTATATPSVGLGGLDPSQNKLGLAGTGSTRTDNKAVKEIQVPNEIVETVDNFKNFLKIQKNLSSDVARGSTEPLNKVQEETENLKQALASLQNGIQRSSSLVVRLKSDTAKCLQNAEMAQRTHETPPGLQYDNIAPLKYFQDLVANFEHEMKVFRLEINNTEKHLHSLMQPMPLTSQELSLAMRRLHDSFVALAGRLQSVHNSVEAEKNQYLLMRKNYQKDSSNVFEEEAKKTVLASAKTKSSFKSAAGPTPFSALGGQHGFGLLSSSSTLTKPSLSSGWSAGQTPQPQFQQPLLQQAQTPFQQTQFSTPTLSNTLFSGSNTSSLTSPQPVENQSFQLQKPPVGNKRGKR